MKAEYNIDITLVSCGKMALYNGYLPGNKHAPRKEKNIEDIFFGISDEPLPEGRYYLQLELGGEVIGDGIDFSIPTVKYIFKQ